MKTWVAVKELKFLGAPSVIRIPTLGLKVYRYDLLWATWSPRD